MSVQIGSATDYADLLNQLDTFLTGTGMALTPAFTGTGNGTIVASGGSAGVAEVITVTFTTATAFGVVGSVSGSLGTGVAGTPFTSTKANLTITVGGTAFVSGDHFVFSVTPPWTSLRRTTGVEMIWSAPGNGGTDAIIVGASIFSNVGADYYNWRLGGFSAFNSGAVFNQQPGYVGGASQATPSPVLTLWDSTIPYWFIANGRRVIIVAKVSTVYACAYLGFATSYMAPGSYPYPLVVGGNLAFAAEPVSTSTSWRWSYTGSEMKTFATPHAGTMTFDYLSSLRLRLATGIWRGFDEAATEPAFGQLWPRSNFGTDWRPNLDGSYTLLPNVMFDPGNVYGELEGIHALTGFSQGAENTVTVAGIKYLVMQDVFRNTVSDFFAVRLT